MKKKKLTPFKLFIMIAAGVMLACFVVIASAGVGIFRRLSRPIWHYKVGSEVISAPVVIQDNVYFGSFAEEGSSAFYSLDRTHGNLNWRMEIEDQVAQSPSVSGRLVLAGTTGGNLLAFDRASGQMQWKFSAENVNLDPGCKCGPQLTETVVAGDTVLVGSNNHFLYALDIESGRVKWSFETTGSISGRPVIAGQRVYLGSQDNTVTEIELETGKELRRWPLPCYLSPEQMERRAEECGVYMLALDNEGGLYLTNGTLVAMDLQNGQVKWHFSTNSTKETLARRVLVDKERVYTLGDDRLYAVDRASGTVTWSRQAGFVFDGPALDEGILYWGNWRGQIVSIEAASGHPIDRYEMYLLNPTALFSGFPEFAFPPTISNGVIYIPWNKALYAIRAQ